MAGFAPHRTCCLPGSAIATLLVSLLVSPGRGSGESGSIQESKKSAGRQVAKDPSPPQHESLAPVVAVQKEDYARARRQFRTKLLRQGPAPQAGSPVMPPDDVTEVVYRSGALRLKAWVNRPTESRKKRPAVLFLHGGFAFDRDDWVLSQPYRAADFIVMTPILRGENGQPGSFSFWYDEVDDVLAAADFLGDQPYVDASRMYIAGSSAGGTLCLLAAMTSKRFQAAASFSASPDQALLVKHARMELPFDKSNARELELRSPLAYAASFKCPVRIYYGTQDHFVLTSRRTAEIAKQQGLDVEAVPIEGDHGSSVPPAIQQSIRFFQGK
jgi:dipeptidyl aminopeptidase/acylaminoacyl peptidase